MRLAQARCVMIGAAALLAGCIGPAAPVETADADIAVAPSAATNFEWRTANLSGNVAIELAFEFTARTECETEYAITNSGAQGTDSVLYALGPEGELLSWGAGGSGNVVSLHAGALDTREFLQSGRGATGWSGTTEFPAGTSRVRLHALGAEASDNPITEGDSVFARLACKGPIALAGASFSREVFIVGLGTMEEGVGATVGFAAAASIEDASAFEFASEHVAAHFLATGFHAARVELGTPDGPRAIEFAPGLDLREHYVEGGPGPWSASVTGADAFFSVLTGVVAGYAPVEGLDAIRDA